VGFPKNIGRQLSLPIVIDQFGQSHLTHFHSFIPCVYAKMKARNRLASRNLVELIRCNQFVASPKTGSQQLEHFWPCGECSKTMILICVNQSEVKTLGKDGHRSTPN